MVGHIGLHDLENSKECEKRIHQMGIVILKSLARVCLVLVGPINGLQVKSTGR